MNKKFLTKYGVLLAAGLGMVAPAVYAGTPWIGTADYKNAPGALGDEAVVGPFDTYDFGAGIGLVKIKDNGPVVNGAEFTGVFQTMVDGHFLGQAGINVPELNISGSGAGFELTFVSNFSGTFTNVSDSSWDFNITGGSASLKFDSTPNYNFANDSGFNDGASILQGTVTNGVGSIQTPGVVGIGVEQVALDFSGIFGSFDPKVYQPGTINGGSSLFSIKSELLANYTPIIEQVRNGSNSVLGTSAIGGQLSELDGTLQLTAVPVPTAVWLFLSGLMGILCINKRKQINA